MKEIGGKNERTDVNISNKILEEKEMLYSKPKRKKYFDHCRVKKMKKVIKRSFIALLSITLISYFVLICTSADFSEDKIYDEYKELDDKEFSFIVKEQMKKLTISKNVNVNFVIMYKEVPLDDFLSGKIVDEKNVTVIYNPVDKTLNMTSNLEYLIDDYKWENIEDVKKEIPKYFSMIDKKIEKNVYIADFHTLTFDHFKSKENVVLAYIFIMIILGVILVCKL